MKIQLSDKRIIKDAITIWNQPGPEVDMVMDLKNLTFRQGSIDEMFAFHVVDSFFPEDVPAMMKNWNSILKVNGKAHILNDNFEYLARGFVGGDFSVELFNDLHNHPNQCTQESVVKFLKLGGFNDDKIVIWFNGSPSEELKIKHYEFILTATKHE